MRAQQLIRKEFGNSKNFMTPKILEYGWIVDNRIAYELSTGEGFDHEPIFGVSLVRCMPSGKTERIRQPISDVFHSQALARRHIRKLQERWARIV